MGIVFSVPGESQGRLRRNNRIVARGGGPASGRAYVRIDAQCVSTYPLYAYPVRLIYVSRKAGAHLVFVGYIVYGRGVMT